MARPPKILGTVGLAAFAFLLALTSQADAALGGHTYRESFGTPQVEGQPLRGGQFPRRESPMGMGVSVAQATGDVYVLVPTTFLFDPLYPEVEKFDAEGHFILAWGFGVTDGEARPQVCTVAAECREGIPGQAPGQLERPTEIVVDNSAGPNRGDVYVADPGHDAVFRYSPTGTFEREIDGSETPRGAFRSLGGIAVDGHGYLWVLEEDVGRVMKFSNSGSNAYVGNSQFAVSPTKPGAYEGFNNYPGLGLAVNSAGSAIYVASYGPSPAGNAFSIYDFAPDGSLATESPEYPPEYPVPLLATDFTTGDVFSAVGENVTMFTSELSEVPGSSFGAGHLSHTGGVAINETTDVAYVSNLTTYSSVQVYEPRYVPDVTSENATSVGHTDATLNGTAAPDARGGGPVSACYFEYGTSESYGSSVPCEQATPISQSTQVSAALSSLTQDKTYHYRLVAANGDGTSYGADQAVTPHAVFGTTTEAAGDITSTSATLNGSFEPAGLDTHYYFKWGRNVVYGKTMPAPPGNDAGSGSSVVHVSVTLEGLENSTPYHYRLVTKNSLGTSQGEDQTFTSGPPDLPRISQPAVATLGPNSARIEAEISAGYGDTMYLAEYGPRADYGEVSEIGTLSELDNAPHRISTELTGLQPGTTYHYRLVAANFGGTSHSADYALTTPSMPGISASEASAITPTSAKLAASILSNGEPSSYHFEDGISASYGAKTAESASSGAEQIAATAEISGLAPGTTYHFRVAATNSIGTSYGPDVTFTTPTPAPKQGPKPQPCKKHFVRRHGKCVAAKRHHKSHKGHRRGR
jgi:hypothetical protein